MHINTALNKIFLGEDLSELEAYSLMIDIANYRIPQEQIKRLLIALKAKGETVEEIAGFVRALRETSIKVEAKSYPLVDNCGTGGDESNTFNISTTAAFIAAGAGVKMAKHGNRRVSSKSGSADVLEALGVNINLSPGEVASCIDTIGIGFLFARSLHPAMEYVAPVRKELGVRTVFNLLGPLVNPAGATRQVVGVFDPRWILPIAYVLKNLGAERAFIIHGAGGLDEISTLGETQVAEVWSGNVNTYVITPEDFDIKRVKAEDIHGGTPEENALIVRACLNPNSAGPCQDIALLNASAAIVAADLAENLIEGLWLARESLCDGRAREKLEALVALSTA